MIFVTNTVPARVPDLERALNAHQVHHGEPPVVRLVTKAPMASAMFTAEELAAFGLISVWKEDVPQTP